MILLPEKTDLQKMTDVVSNLFNVQVAIEIIKVIIAQNQEKKKFEALVGDICNRVEKIIDNAFLREYEADLRALQDLVEDYSRSNDVNILDELQVLSRTLYQRFTDFSNFEGILLAIHAATLYMIVLKSKAEHNSSERDNLIHRGNELSPWLKNKADILYNYLEKSLPSPCTTTYTTDDNQCRPNQVGYRYALCVKTSFFDTISGLRRFDVNANFGSHISEDDINPMWDDKKIYEALGKPGWEKCIKERERLYQIRKSEAESLKASFYALANSWENIT